MKLGMNGYIERKSLGGTGHTNKPVWRNWFLVKAHGTHYGIVSLGAILLSEEYIGKRVRFKIEVIKE